LMVVGIALFAFMDPHRVRALLTGRQARYGSNALVMTLAFVGILGVANYLAYENPKRWDLTEDAEHTLLTESLDTLKAMPHKVEALAFYQAGSNIEQAKKLLDSYKYYGEGQFDYRFIDPISDPVTARSVNVPIETSGTIVLVMADRQEKAAFAAEQEITGAMVRLLSEELGVYFLTGHGEYSPEEFGEESYTSLKRALEAKNYSVHMLNLLAVPTIPDDANVIVIAGPRKPVTEQEVVLLDQFLAQGGGLVVLQEPVLLTDFGDDPDPLAEYLASDWGAILGQDVVIDYSSDQPFLAFSAAYNEQHLITNRMQRMVAVFPTARSVSAGPSTTGANPVELVFTAPQSWAETDLGALERGEQPVPTEGVDIVGNVPLVVASERWDTNGRVVVFGDADFPIDANFSYLGNGDMIINAIDWTAEQEDLINLNPRQPQQRILIQPSTIVKGAILFGSVFVPAGLVIFSGIAVYIQRRKRG
jgi:ABC-type uncharacterized transport system involved in gliding motility auxiliary subunit